MVKGNKVKYKTDNFTGVLNRLASSEAISKVKCIIMIQSGESKFSKKETDNFTRVLNRLTGSEAISEVKCIIMIRSGERKFSKKGQITSPGY